MTFRQSVAPAIAASIVYEVGNCRLDRATGREGIMRLPSLLVLLLLAIPTFVSAQSTPDADFCAGSAGTVDDRIAACTSAITSGRLSAASLAVAFRNRGNAWSAKGDKDRAIADYNEAIRLYPKSATAYRNRGIVRIPGAPAFGDGGNAKAQHLTPKVSALLKTAQELMNATPPKYAEAIAKLKEADAFPPKRRRHSSADQRTRYCGTCPDARTVTRKHPPKRRHRPSERHR